MAAPSISFGGIESAVVGLKYSNQNALKCRLVQAIKRYYDAPDALSRLQRIPPEELIAAIWNTGPDAGRLQSKWYLLTRPWMR